jgi:hypothetical protein
MEVEWFTSLNIIFSQPDGLGIGEGTALKNVSSNLAQKFIRITNVK